MREWKETILGDITTKITKGTTPTTLGFSFKEEGINFIKAEAITMDGRFIKDKFTFIDEKTNHVLRRSILEQDDILFSMAGMILGKTAVVTNDIIPANTNQALAIIRIDKSKANPWFVNYYLSESEYFRYVNSITAQSAQPNISLSEISDLPIKLPSLKEQNEIVSILSSLDNKIDLLRRQNQTLEQLAQTIFKQWFVDGGKTYELGDLLKTVSETYDFKTVEELIFLNTSNISEGQILHNNYTDVSILPGQAKKRIKQDDILYSEIRPENKRFAYVDFDSNDYVVSTKLMVLRAKAHVHSIVLYFYLTLPETIKALHVQAEARSGTFPQITFSQVEELLITIPPDEELGKVTESLKAIFLKTKNNQKEIQTLTQLRDSLLPRLMSGRLRLG